VTTAVSRIGSRVLGGYFVLLALFLYAPLVVLVIFSFDDSQVQTLPYAGFTLRWFHAVFSNGDLVDAVQRSAVIALFTAVGATPLRLITPVGVTAKRAP